MPILQSKVLCGVCGGTAACCGALLLVLTLAFEGLLASQVLATFNYFDEDAQGFEIFKQVLELIDQVLNY